MINTKYILYAILTAGFLASCSVLEQEPQDSVTPELAFADEKAARAALNGMYSRMQNEYYYGAYFQYIADNYADISRFLGFFIEFRDASDRALPATNFAVEQIWLAIYRVINVANEIIAKVPDVVDDNFTAEERAQIIAEARCIRGLCYLDLLTYWGEHWDANSQYGVPLVTQSTNSDFANVELLPRNNVAEVYNFIIADLEAAEKDLPDSDDAAYASQALAKGLLARTYLYRGDYQQAEQKAGEVIGNTNYELNPDYEDIFLSDLTSESVFELVANAQDPTSLAVYTIGRDEVRPREELIESFMPNDARLSMIGEVASRPGIRLLKADDFSTDANPAYIMRIAEMYLIRAEALYRQTRLGEALDDLNAVHTRAGLTAYNSTDNFLAKLLDEWRWEFFQEGHRFRALVRLGQAQSVLGIPDFRRVYPIPFRELTIEGNLMEQNPGYN